MIYKDESVFVGDRIATWMFYVSCTAIFQNDNFDAFEGWKVGYIGQGDQNLLGHPVVTSFCFMHEGDKEKGLRLLSMFPNYNDILESQIACNLGVEDCSLYSTPNTRWTQKSLADYFLTVSYTSQNYEIPHLKIKVSYLSFQN